MFCLYCGSNLPEDAIFCNKCGKQQKIVKSESESENAIALFISPGLPEVATKYATSSNANSPVVPGAPPTGNANLPVMPGTSSAGGADLPATPGTPSMSGANPSLSGSEPTSSPLLSPENHSAEQQNLSQLQPGHQHALQNLHSHVQHPNHSGQFGLPESAKLASRLSRRALLTSIAGVTGIVAAGGGLVWLIRSKTTRPSSTSTDTQPSTLSPTVPPAAV